MKIQKTRIEGLLEIIPDVFPDNRGQFQESYNKKLYKEMGIPTKFVQDNISVSYDNVIRGLHYQIVYPQAKLVSCLSGEIIDYAVDLRVDSKTFKDYFALRLSGENHTQLYIPEGFAHGFAVISAPAIVMYKTNNYRFPEYERGIRPTDPTLNIIWPYDFPILSERDKNLPFFTEIFPNDTKD
jgi:dTDP-4-dehydrorhamnose 3,5-epimerase